MREANGKSGKGGINVKKNKPPKNPILEAIKGARRSKNMKDDFKKKMDKDKILKLME